MTDQNRTILQWVLGIGILIAGAKVVIDLGKSTPSPPVVADAPKSSDSTAASNAPADPLLPLVGNGAEGKPRKGSPATAVSAGEDNPLAGMQQMLATIAQDPLANKPSVTQKDAQNGLILYGFEIQGLQQPVLAVIDGKPEAWAWSFGSNIPPELFAPAGKTEPVPSPGAGASAIRLLQGPLAGVVVITVDEQPRARILKSVAFQQFEQAADAAASASGLPRKGGPPATAPRKGAH